MKFQWEAGRVLGWVGVKTGCGCGCLVIILMSLLIGGIAWFEWGLFDRPTPRHEVGTVADGHRAQQKLWGLAAAGTGTHPKAERPVAVTLSERELNAFLTRHVPIGGLPLAEESIQLIGNGIVELGGSVPLSGLFGHLLGPVVERLPEPWPDRPVWVRLRGDVRLEIGAGRADRRRLRLDVDSLWVGSRRLPTSLLHLLPEGPVLRATRWTLPRGIDSVLIEPGLVTVTRRS